MSAVLSKASFWAGDVLAAVMTAAAAAVAAVL